MGRDTQNTDYFSADNLGRLSRVDEHLAFVEGISEKYMGRIPTDVTSAGGDVRQITLIRKQKLSWNEIHQQISFIRKKKNDKKLNISVIGEFSTGKSTFINALLRKELLASSALQGTTVASTVIDYSEGYEIELEYLDGRPGEELRYSCFQELRKGLERFTTDSSVARLLKSVNVFLPADILKNDFRIIDTPGTNVTEAWHEDVTVRALKEKSDLSIILTSAEKPVPNTMLGFVKKHLESILPQCVFVVTKLDLIRPRERNRQLAYIKMKLEEELEIRDAVALPYISPMVLGSEMSMDDGSAEAKKRLCIVGSYGEDKRSLAERLRNQYDITVCDMQELYSDPVGQKRMRAVVNEATDVIMLLNATRLWSSDEKNFIHGCGCGERLIIAVNHMDQVRQEEIPAIKAYCKRNMDFFATPDARICYISTDSEDIGISELAEELAKDGEQDKPEKVAKGVERDEPEKVAVDDTLLGMSLETEQKLIQHTAKQRTLAVTKKLTQLIDDIYKSISGQMERISKDYESKLALLERSKKADLNLFVRQEKGERLQHFDGAMKELSEDMEQGIYAKAAGACASVVGNLDDKGNLDQLKTYINNSLSGDCRKQAETLMYEADCYCRQIQCIFRDEMRSFHDSFQKIYQSLDIIPLDMSQSKYDFPEKAAIETADIAGAANYIAEKLKSENGKMLGGAAAGAAIGTAVAPGIGTVIGGFLGFMLAPSEDTSQVRKACKDKLNPQLANYYNSVSDKVTSVVDKYIKQMRTCLSDEIDKYLKRYRSEVDRQIAMENNRRWDINTQISELKADMAGIQNHKKQLDSVIAQLNNLGRKE